MAALKTSQKWIVAGYEMFAFEGPNGFNIENLSRQLGLNKSGFYHYFLERDIFFEELMKHHDRIGVEFAAELSHLKDFMPEYPMLMVKYQTGLHVQMQLRKNITVPLFKEYYNKVKKRNYKYQLPLWAKYVQISDMNLAAELFEIAVDLMVIRLENDKITYDYLEGIFNGIKQTIEKLRLNK